MMRPLPSSDFIRYVLSAENETAEHLPSLQVLSQQLGLSVTALREQVEVAKAIGLVEVRPRTGIRRLPYRFFPAVWQSLACAIALDRANFAAFADLRMHLEAAYWHEAAPRLTAEDIAELQSLMSRAWDKLNSNPVQVPHEEHRQLHLTIYRRLDNPFVQGLLEAYWQAYESVGMNVYADLEHLRRVWSYHQQIVDALIAGNLEQGYRALIAHQNLLFVEPAHA